MTYIKVTLPDLETLKEQLKNPEKLRYYNKYDIWTGSQESMKYLREALKRTKI